jgi:excisionase family DNA binding protein
MSSPNPTQSPDPEELLTLKEVEILLKVCRMTVYRWINKEKRLPAVRMNTKGAQWRVRRRDAMAMLGNGEAGPMNLAR